jgi:PTH1 family peptidyl-tRNA hydrolase
MNAPSSKICVIVGLGNPGKKYELTRHNLGYLVVQGLATIHGWSFKEEPEFNAKVATGRIADQKIHLLLPTTYMNESGRAVRRFLDFYKLSPEQLLVVSDDVAIPFQDIRLRFLGSPGGHNGLKSIEAHLRTKNYARLRMGVGEPVDRSRDLADYVLENFNQEELSQLAKFVQKGTAVIEQLMRDPITDVMNRIGLKDGV